MNRNDMYFAVYQKALKSLEGKSPSFEDEMIVALWNTTAMLQKSLAEMSLKLSLIETHEENEINEASALLDTFRMRTIDPAAEKPNPTTQGE